MTPRDKLSLFLRYYGIDPLRYERISKVLSPKKAFLSLMKAQDEAYDEPSLLEEASVLKELS